MMTPTQTDPLLRIRNLAIRFGAVRTVDGVSLDLQPGETLALVGESGSGKSVTALAVTGLLPEGTSHVTADELRFAGTDLRPGSGADLRSVRGGGISYIFQDPLGSLNPVVRAGRQIEEAVALHQPDANPRDEALRLLDLAGLQPAAEVARRYPHELSGGMQQRVMLAMALAGRPKLLIADEPTTALDVTVQARVLRLIGDLRSELGMAVLLITHNLGLAAGFADRIAVMYAGRIVETGTVADVLRAPLHPYTKALLNAVPRLDDAGGRREGIPGRVPAPAVYPAGCRFHPRCPVAIAACREQEPPEVHRAPGHTAACWVAAGEKADA